MAKRSRFFPWFQWTPAAGCRIPSTCPSPHRNKKAATTAAHHNIATKQKVSTNLCCFTYNFMTRNKNWQERNSEGKGGVEPKTQVLLETVAVPEVWYIIIESPKNEDIINFLQRPDAAIDSLIWPKRDINHTSIHMLMLQKIRFKWNHDFRLFTSCYSMFFLPQGTRWIYLHLNIEEKLVI